MQETHKLCAGELVEVRSKAEILATLDQDGRLEGLPFMPEMLRYCGKRFRIYKRAHKTCDFVTNTGSRKLPNAVHLEDLRCDGSAHGGCMADCLLFWKEAWLKRLPSSVPADSSAVSVQSAPARSPETLDRDLEDVIWSGTRAVGNKPDDPDPVYICQATLLPNYTQPLSPWDFRQYVEDYRSGNVTSALSMVPRFLYRLFDNVMNLGIGWGSILRWVYDRIQGLRGGLAYPARTGSNPVGDKTPTVSLNLAPGEFVKVRDYPAILETIDGNCKNRGMGFSAEMVPYCGGTYRVRSRVDRLIDERTGKMLTMKNSCVILEGVVCQAKYNSRMIFCPRATFPYWREIWLDRVETSETQASRTGSNEKPRQADCINLPA